MDGDAAAGRSLSLPGWALVIVVYLAIIQGLGLLIGIDTGDAPYPTAESVVRGGLIPIAASLLYAAGVASWLGWWPAIVRSDKPVQRWVWFLPVSMIVAALLAVDYLVLRVSGVLLLPMLVHGLWDFSLLSPQLGPDPAGYAGSVLVILLQVVLIVLLLVRRHRIEPAAAPAAA